LNDHTWKSILKSTDIYNDEKISARVIYVAFLRLVE
jgi:hypothetical protein